MSWQELTLGDAIHIKHGFAFKSKYFSDAGKFIVLTPGNFNESGGFRLRPGKDRFYDGPMPDGFILDEGDLLLAMTEQGPGLLGSSALVPAGSCFLHNQRLGLVDRVDTSRLDKEFLYYLFNTRAVRGQISGSASGVKVRHTAPDRIYRVRVNVPDVPTQHGIAQTLRAYDDLIENNRRRIQLLEESARLLFREWFVHLRFPGHEHVKVVDGVPAGWQQESVAGVCAVFVDGDWIETKDQGGEDFRLLQVSNIGINEFVETGNFRFITEETFRNLRCTEVNAGDVLLSRMPKPIGRGWMVSEMPWRMVTAVDVSIAQPDTEKIDPFYFLYFVNSPGHLGLAAARATGATRPRISRKNMGTLPIIVPTRPLQDEFGAFAQPIHEQKMILARENQRLAEARDLLLPRLMAGELAA